MNLLNKIKAAVHFLPIVALGLFILYIQLDCSIANVLILLGFGAWMCIGTVLAIRGIGYFFNEGNK